LITLRACTSKKVMPRKPGVSNDLVMAPRSNNAGAAVRPAGRPGACGPADGPGLPGDSGPRGGSGWIRSSFHRMKPL
jgi:hypothetical protein